MTLSLIRGGAARKAIQITNGPLRPMSGTPNATRRRPDADGLTDDPAARRRELQVVLALCAAQARGAPEWSSVHEPLIAMRRATDGSRSAHTLPRVDGRSIDIRSNRSVGPVGLVRLCTEGVYSDIRY
jgi:hypothetical protein